MVIIAVAMAASSGLVVMSLTKDAVDFQGMDREFLDIGEG